MNQNMKTDYPETLPYLSPLAATLAAEQGPKCAECAKPHRLSKEHGGCACPRYTNYKGEMQSHKTQQLRQIEAAERLNQLIEVYMRTLGVEIPPQLAGVPIVAEPKAELTGVAAVDNARAKHAAVSKAS